MCKFAKEVPEKRTRIMGCNCGGSVGHGKWDGRILIHPPKKSPDLFAEDKTHVFMKLNSYRQEGVDHLYAITFKFIEIRYGQIYSKASVSGYMKASAKSSTTAASLTMDTRYDPLQLSTFKAQVIQVQNLEERKELTDGSSEYAKYSGPALQISGSVNLYNTTYDINEVYVVPEAGCFYIGYQCVWSNCGPSWAHYPCNFHCQYRFCGNDGKCGSWMNTSSTIECSELIRACGE